MNPRTAKQRLVLVRILTVVSSAALIATLVSTCFLSSHNALAHADPEHRGAPSHSTYIPFMQISQSGATDLIADDSKSETMTEVNIADWPTFTSSTEGFTFRYPPDWKIEEQPSGAVVLSPANSDTHGTIGIGYLLLEIEETETLSEWAHEYFHLGITPDYPREFLPGDLAPSTVIQEQLLVGHGAKVPGAGYLIRNGRYVLGVFSYSDDVPLQEVLKPIAESVIFHESNTEQMRSFQGMPQERRTINKWKAYERDRSDALNAFNERLLTGETPVEQLESMSERAREMYDKLIKEEAEELQRRDQERGSSNQPVEAVDNNEVASTSYHQVGTPDFTGRRGLPPRATAPVREFGTKVHCYSDWHYGKDTFAIDIMVASNTPVYPSIANEEVLYFGWDTSGYGNVVQTRARMNVRGVQKYYYITYAHLNGFAVGMFVGQILQPWPNGNIGLSGETGNATGPHLHYQIYTKGDLFGDTGGNVPVELSPMKGFTANLYYPDAFIYPIRGPECGMIGDPAHTPMLIDTYEYRFELQIAGGHAWTCSNYYNASAYCYLTLTPIDPEYIYNPLVIDSAPRTTYEIYVAIAGNYYIWLCGMGRNHDDDGVHITANYQVSPNADRINGYSGTAWGWNSQHEDGTGKPYVYLNQGVNTIQLHGYKNEMRVDRIILTREPNYDPDAITIPGSAQSRVRCGGEALPKRP